MKSYLKISQIEFVHLKRSPFKTVSIFLFVIAIVYGCQNGYNLFNTHNEGIASIKKNNDRSIKKMLLQYEEIESGMQEKPRRDPTIPYWAIWNTPSHVFKYPSPMMVFSLGQSEQYGYYKRVTNWSTTYDSDLAEEIANPERLAIGTLDFNFVLIYLAPILFIILLFNIGGLEKDLNFENLIYLNNQSKKKWLFTRFLFYFFLTFILVFIFTFLYGSLIGVFQNHTSHFIYFMLLVLLYLTIWFTVFYFINLSGSGSSDQALKMISVWLILCIIIPGFLHQVTSLKYPTNYMTDYLDVNRDQGNNLFKLPEDTLMVNLLEAFPNLYNTAHASDTSMNKAIVKRSMSGLINILNKKVSDSIERSSEDKNKFIKSFFKVNPVTFFHNEINAIADTDYYAYKNYRNQIQETIDKKIELILMDTWNKVVVDKEKYLQYIKKIK